MDMVLSKYELDVSVNPGFNLSQKWYIQTDRPVISVADSVVATCMCLIM